MPRRAEEIACFDISFEKLSIGEGERRGVLLGGSWVGKGVGLCMYVLKIRSVGKG